MYGSGVLTFSETILSTHELIGQWIDQTCNLGVYVTLKTDEPTARAPDLHHIGNPVTPFV